jgi:hypothetical protein
MKQNTKNQRNGQTWKHIPVIPESPGDKRQMEQKFNFASKRKHSTKKRQKLA